MAQVNRRAYSENRANAVRNVSSRSKKKRKKRGYGVKAIFFIAVFVSLVSTQRYLSQKNTLSELKVEEKRLEAEKEKQLDIKKDIEEKAVYVNTKAYIEDMAKKLGLVYPDEVIFKPEED